VWLAAFARRRRLLPRWEWRLVRRMAAFGSLSYLSLLLDLVTVRLDIILLNAMASTPAAGVYSVAVAVGARLASIPQIVAYVVFHRTSARELGSGARTAQILRLATLALLGGGIVGGVLGSALIVPLYGPEFAAAVSALWVMIPAMGIWGLYRLLASDVEGRGRPGLVSMSSLMATMTIVALDLAWIPKHGILGAAWASLVAYSVAFAVVAFQFCRVTGMSFRDAYLYRPDDLGALLRLASRLVRSGRLADQPG
jgi:O-antigen/teichoic acid export membrane protein